MKDPLWREIFIDSTNPDESDESSEDETNFQDLYLKYCKEKGLKVDPTILQQTKGKKRQINSAVVELVDREKNPNFTLPPIKHPSMHPKEKPFASAEEELLFERMMKKQKRDEAKQNNRNAESNL